MLPVEEEEGKEGEEEVVAEEEEEEEDEDEDEVKDEDEEGATGVHVPDISRRWPPESTGSSSCQAA